MAHPFHPVGPRDADANPDTSFADTPTASGTTRREFLKFVVAGSTLVVGGTFMPRSELRAQEGPDFFDVGDFLVLSEEPYASNLVLEVGAHNRVHFELPRLDKGQGIVTAMAMLIAEVMDADYERTDVTLSDARADRPYSLTGYSCTVRSMWSYVPPLAAEARARLVTAAANRWDVDATTLTTAKSMVFAPDGRRASYGELSAEAAAVIVPLVSTQPKDPSQYTLVGQPTVRKNAREIVTGAQKYTLDIDLPGAVHAVVARPPTIYGTVTSYDDSAAVAMPNVVGTVQIPQLPHPMANALEGGVAVAARTYQEAFAARDAIQVNWGPGPLASTSDADLRAQLVAAAQPLLPAAPGASVLDASFDFPYVNHGTLEPQTAAANVQGSFAEVWFPTQSPLLCKQLVAEAIGVPEANVTVHVPPCGGSFGRHLFSEAPVEAAIVSQQLGKPVKLLWTRNDDMRNGRFRPMSHHDLRATWLPDAPIELLTYEHNVSAAETDFHHGLGEAMSAGGWDSAALQLNQSVFEGSVVFPYAFPVKNQNLVETTLQVPTCSWRSIYSGFTTTANEIFTDEVARAMGVDEVAWRVQHLTDDRARACLEHVANAGNWGATLPPGHAQGVAAHVEYRSAVAYLVEIDASDPADPRLVKAFVAVDLGLPINPLGAKAQLQGALIDGFSVMLRAGNTLTNGRIDQSSYGDFRWARMNHAPFTTDVHVFPASSQDPSPGGCGELGLPPASAACVNAYARATGGTYHQFPILEFI